jgi:hypothetical protein
MAFHVHRNGLALEITQLGPSLWNWQVVKANHSEGFPPIAILQSLPFANA